MLNLVVSPHARAQLAALPEVAAQAVADTIALLLQLPHVGVPIGIADRRGDFYRKLVVVRRRRWTLHVVYLVQGNELRVEFVDPSWVQRTHSGDE